MAKHTNSTKSKIVSAAWELFYSQGYENTTIDDIVHRSQTSKGSFYHYFESKDSILSSLSYLFDEKYEELEKSLDFEQNAFDLLILLNQEMFDMIDNRIEPALLSRLYSSQILSRGDKSLTDQSRFYYRLLRRIIVNGQAKQEITTEMTASDIVRFYAMCERSLICEWCLCDWNYSLKYHARQYLPLMLQGIKC